MKSYKFDHKYIKQNEGKELKDELSISEFCPDHFNVEFQSDPKVCSKSNMMHLVREFYQVQKFNDVLVHIGNQSFNCHLLIVQCYSTLFGDRYKSEKVIKLPEDTVTSNAFQNVYSWMLSSPKTVQRNGLLELLTAAEFLLIECLVHQCWLLIEDCRLFREGYCL